MFARRMMDSFLGFLVIVVGGFLNSGCSDNDSKFECTPGSTQVCFCPGGGLGVQTCEGNKTWGSCEGCESGAQCGNNVIEESEACDGTNLAGETCYSQGFYAGTLGCLSDCSDFDTSSCHGFCGDGTINGSEVCDGLSLGGETCESLDYHDGGVLACLDDCSGFDTSGCEGGYCGDGVINGPEICDGSDLGGETCESFGFNSGALACPADCTGFDTSGCYTDPLLVTWITIPGGAFNMGSNDGWSNEQPIHSVTVPTFEMAKTQVTVEQYEVCVTAGVCTEPSTWNSLCNWHDSGYEDHPVNCISWVQAREFCEWAGGRLPSEAEWEYSARSRGQNITYPWGNDTATCNYAVMREDEQTGCGNGRTWPVCSKVAGNTDHGLCDMAGNVWEWMEDDWHDSYTGAPDDGSAWVDEPRGSLRVLRGGCIFSGTDSLRAAYRGHNDPSVYFGAYGFRCAR